MVKVRFLGTNGWYVTDTGHTTCHLIESDSCYIILDAGSGIYKIDQYIKGDKPIYLFLSHLHLDHIQGLHILNRFTFSQGINIFAHEDSIKKLKSIVRQPFTVPFDKLKCAVNLFSFKNGYIKGLPFVVQIKKLVHVSPCFGFRIELEDKIISYCTDTGPCKNIADLSRGADLLITECSLLEGEVNTSWPHMNPTDSAKLAKASGVKKLALIHFDSEKYPTIRDRERAIKESIRIFENSFMTIDDMEITLD